MKQIKDPVCGMIAREELSYEYLGRIFYFCSAFCREKFVKSPDSYVTPSVLPEELCVTGGREVAYFGISVTKGKGYGEYANFFTSDWFSAHARLEIYCEASRTDEIVKVIMDAGHSGLAGDGLVAVIPVEKVYRIKTMAEGNGGDV